MPQPTLLCWVMQALAAMAAMAATLLAQPLVLLVPLASPAATCRQSLLVTLPSVVPMARTTALKQQVAPTPLSPLVLAVLVPMAPM